MSEHTKEPTKFVNHGSSVFVNKYYYDKLQSQRDELLAACEFALQDDGLIPRVRSECREVIRKALASLEDV